MTYSFSRLSSYETCPYQFYTKYILGVSEEQNGWGELGGYNHETIEKVLRKELTVEETPAYYQANIPNVDFPTMRSGYKEKYINDCISFFNSFRGVNDKILGVERHFTFELEGVSLQGYIDLETLSNDGKLKQIDWKTGAASGFAGKKLTQKARQLYLYSHAMYLEHGRYPDEMFFYLIREKKPIKVKWKQREFDEAVEWMVNIVNNINNNEGMEWVKKENQFFCANLCGNSQCNLNRNYGR